MIPQRAIRPISNDGSPRFALPARRVERISHHRLSAGTFGTFLLLAHNCAEPDATRRSYDVFARYVMPYFQRTNAGRHASYMWTQANDQRLGARVGEAVAAAIQSHFVSAATAAAAMPRFPPN